LKPKTYNVHETFPFGEVIWGVNLEKETVTCILKMDKDKLELVDIFVSHMGKLNGVCSVCSGPFPPLHNKYIVTCKASHGDEFDVKMGMAMSLFKCMMKAGMGENMTSWNKVLKEVDRHDRRKEDKSTMGMCFDDREGYVQDNRTGYISDLRIDDEFVGEIYRNYHKAGSDARTNSGGDDISTTTETIPFSRKDDGNHVTITSRG
jgi:hypothetical protein